MSEVFEDDFAFVYLDIDSPAVAWLAYRGVLISPNHTEANPQGMSWFIIDVMRRGLASTLNREAWLEAVRQRDFRDHTSRLHCIYAFPTYATALDANQGIGKFRKETIVAIQPHNLPYLQHDYDMDIATNFDSLGNWDETAKAYWNSRDIVGSSQESLLSGKFRILGTEVRQRAYETIKKHDPRSLAFLELSRLAVDFGSDLGMIAPVVTVDDGKPTVRLVIKYDEQEGLEIWKNALERKNVEPEYQINFADLRPLMVDDADDPFCAPNDSHFAHDVRVDKAKELFEKIKQILAETEKPSAGRSLATLSPGRI